MDSSEETGFPPTGTASTTLALRGASTRLLGHPNTSWMLASCPANSFVTCCVIMDLISVTWYLMKTSIVWGSCVFILNNSSMNSSYEMSPLPSLSKMPKTASTSSELNSISAMSSWKLGISWNPRLSSLNEIMPEESLSNSAHKALNSSEWALLSRAFSVNILFVSSCDALIDDSTTMESMTFKTINSIKTKAVKKNSTVAGSSSMMGMDTEPQLSPAMICCMKVKEEVSVVS
mmetsp:Transcript_103299/g.289422  ORF Transcript_103299/g.289422 Transcript_103299/m.289422 type:complete len:233 (-) Transcript_103299:703-1401(-)